jgi:hypothetical protein
MIWDGLKAFGLGETSLVFTHSMYPTVSLTRQIIRATYSLEPKLEYYLAERPQTIASASSFTVANSLPGGVLDAIKPRPTISQFWQDSLQVQLLDWVGQPRLDTMLPKRVLDLGDKKQRAK